MEERPTTLATHVAVGPDTDAEGVATAALRLRREFLDLDVDAAELPLAGEPPPGPGAVELAALGAPVVIVAQVQLLTLWWPRLRRPCLRRGQPPRGASSAPTAVCQ